MAPGEHDRRIHAAWEAMAAGWDARHSFFEAISRPVTEWLVGRLAPEPGQTVLDLAAGTGAAGFAAAPLVQPGGRVIVSDFASAMVEAAKGHAARLGLENVDCRELDAQDVDLPDASVDGVLCRWGYMLMPDPAAALMETRRVLRDDGRLALAVFGDPAVNAWASLPAGLLAEQSGAAPPAGAPGVFALADPERLRSLLAGAGFTNVDLDEVPFTFRFAGADDYWDFLTHTAGAIAMLIERLPAAEQERLRERITDRLADYAAGDHLELPAVSLVALAAR